jgi:hypothetical protein
LLHLVGIQCLLGAIREHAGVLSGLVFPGHCMALLKLTDERFKFAAVISVNPIVTLDRRLRRPDPPRISFVRSDRHFAPPGQNRLDCRRNWGFMNFHENGRYSAATLPHF